MDVSPGEPTALRPLGLGELLDRAVTVCVRNFWVLAAIYVAFAALIEIFQYLAGPDRVQMMSAITEALKQQTAGHPATDLLKTLSQNPGTIGRWDVLLIATFLLLFPLTEAAMTFAAGALCLGRPATFGEAYAVGLRRWPQLILLNLTYAAAGVAVYIAVLIVILLFAFVLAAAIYALKGIGVALAVVVGIVAFVAALGAAVVAGLAYQVSLCTCVLEGAPFLAAFGAGLRRVFEGVGLRRSLLVGLAYFAIFFGLSIVSSIGAGVLFGVLHSQLLGAIFSALTSVVAGAFSTVFLVLFYYDLRVREEGFDLQLSAGALPVAPSAVN